MKDKVKDKSKKVLVEVYQQGVQRAIDEINSRDGKLATITKDYLKVLEENIRRAPYVLGYMEWPDQKKKKQE
jgi:hypothetical protein